MDRFDMSAGVTFSRLPVPAVALQGDRGWVRDLGPVTILEGTWSGFRVLTKESRNTYVPYLEMGPVQLSRVHDASGTRSRFHQPEWWRLHHMLVSPEMVSSTVDVTSDGFMKLSLTPSPSFSRAVDIVAALGRGKLRRVGDLDTEHCPLLPMIETLGTVHGLTPFGQALLDLSMLTPDLLGDPVQLWRAALARSTNSVLDPLIWESLAMCPGTNALSSATAIAAAAA